MKSPAKIRDTAKNGHFGNPNDRNDRSMRWAAWSPVGGLKNMPIERRFATRAAARAWLETLAKA
jgi:hypothetical protein